MFYQKIRETLPELAKIEFIRLCEENNNSFTFGKLKKNTVQAARKVPKSTSIMLNPVHSTFDNRSSEYDTRSAPVTSNGPSGKQEESPHVRREMRSCFYCKQSRPIAQNCYARQRAENTSKFTNKSVIGDTECGDGASRTNRGNWSWMHQLEPITH